MILKALRYVIDTLIIVFNLKTDDNKPNLLKGRTFYKPFSYPEFYDRWKDHERSHWLSSEVPMHEDVNDYHNKLDDKQRLFLNNLFRFFTQNDVEVSGGYCRQYLPHFSKTPEISMFLCSVAAREGTHIDAYSYLIETLGLPESTYKEFLEYSEMVDKQEYIKKYESADLGSLGDVKLVACLGIFLFVGSWYLLGLTSLYLLPVVVVGLLRLYNYKQRLIKEHIAAGIALFSGFIEGMQLFSSFVMLLSFPMNGLMKGMGQIITWSIVDESQHIDGMISIFKIFLRENTACKCNVVLGCSCIRKRVLEETVYKIATHMVELEDAFINLSYKEYAEDEMFMNISKTTLKKYIRFIVNKRLKSMGYEYMYDVKRNPLPAFEVMINAPIHTNFFENRSTDYTKTANGSWIKVWGKG